MLQGKERWFGNVESAFPGGGSVGAQTGRVCRRPSGRTAAGGHDSVQRGDCLAAARIRIILVLGHDAGQDK